MSAAQVAPLDVARVRRTLAQLRGQLAEAVTLLEGLYAERAWLALGLPSWEALCAEELPELGRLLDVAQRREVVVALRRGGASLRAAAAPVRVGVATAKAWADAAGVVVDVARGTDGKMRRATRETGRHRAVPLTVRIGRVLAEAGPEGLTVAEVTERVRGTRVEVGPALVRLVQSGRAVYVRPERRGRFGRYCAGMVAR